VLDFLEHMRYQLSAQIPLGKLLLETSERQSDHIGTDEPDDGGVVGEDAYDPARRLISLLTRSKGLVLQISPMAAHLTQPRRSPQTPPLPGTPTR
jgi:hypothetical protein